MGRMAPELDLAWLDPSLRGLTRRDASGLGSGLCRAIAERIGVDPVLVRVALIVLILSGGLGIGLYAWGTVLTRGPSGTRPIDSVLPTFTTWSSLAQKAAVVVTVILVMVSIVQVMPLPWAAGVLALVVWAWLRRRKPGAVPQAEDAVDDTEDDELLIGRWRTRMASAARSAAEPARPLPTVDLYSEPAPVEGHKPRPAWLAGLLILGAMGAVGAVLSLALGVTPMVSLAAVTIAGGALVLGYALLARGRRLPRLILVAVTVPLAMSGWLATQAAGPLLPSPDAVTYSVIAGEKTIDLTTIDTTKVDAVEIKAVASDVEVLLPGPVEDLRTTSRLADVTVDAWPDDAKPFDVTLIVDATASNVRLVVREP